MKTHSVSQFGEESVPATEARDVDELLLIMREIQEEKDRRNRPVPREVHPKQHACVRAEFIVEPDLAAELREGIFRAPRTFLALVRFSNAKQRDDRLPDAHGMAIKLLNVGGVSRLGEEPHRATQDFVLIDHPVFFAKDVRDLVPLMHDFRRLMLGGVWAKARTVFKAATSRDARFRLLRAAGAKRPDHLLDVQYWTTTPVKFGDGAIKVSLRPVTGRASGTVFHSRDKLRLALAAHLSQRGAEYDFLIQRQTNPATMPIEDATIEWDELESPWRKVATLRIPPQHFDLTGPRVFGESLSFTPWHSLPEHRPLGGINRARLKIYEAMGSRRRELNAAARNEPTEVEVRAVWS